MADLVLRPFEEQFSFVQLIEECLCLFVHYLAVEDSFVEHLFGEG